MSDNYYKLFAEDDDNNSSIIGMNGNHGNTDRLFKGNLINTINFLFPKMNLIPSKEDKRKPVLDSNFSLFSQTPNELENIIELNRNYRNYIQNPPLHESSSSSCFEKEKTELISSIEFYLTHHEQKILKNINQEKSSVSRSNIVNGCNNISLKKNELQNQEVMFPELKSRINSTKFDSKLRKTTTMINNISEKKNNLIIENSQLGVESSTSPIDSFKKYEENDSKLETTQSTNTTSTDNPYSYSYVLKNSLQSTNRSSKSPRMMAMKTNELIFTRSNSRPSNKTNDINKKKCSTKPKKSTNVATTNYCKNIEDNIIKNDDIENNKKSVDCCEHSKVVYQRESNNEHFNQQQYSSSSNYYSSDDDSINKNQKYRISFIDCGQIPSIGSERFHNNHKRKIASSRNELFDDDENSILRTRKASY